MNELLITDMVLTKYRKSEFDFSKWLRKLKTVHPEQFFNFIMNSFEGKKPNILSSYEGVKRQLQEGQEFIFVVEYWPSQERGYPPAFPAATVSRASPH